MINPPSSLQGSRERLAVANVGKKNLHSRRQMVHRRSVAFNHAHVLARIDQPGDEMAADKTCTRRLRSPNRP